jgi:hypothetical protein
MIIAKEPPPDLACLKSESFKVPLEGNTGHDFHDSGHPMRGKTGLRRIPARCKLPSLSMMPHFSARYRVDDPSKICLSKEYLYIFLSLRKSSAAE